MLDDLYAMYQQMFTGQGPPSSMLISNFAAIGLERDDFDSVIHAWGKLVSSKEQTLWKMQN